jgi:hypothetical protein
MQISRFMHRLLQAIGPATYVVHTSGAQDNETGASQISSPLSASNIQPGIPVPPNLI